MNNTHGTPIKARRTAPAARAISVVTAAALLAATWPTSPPARAQGTGGLPIIRDAETEQLLRDYTQPILRVAGLAQQNVHVVIINDRSFNAFVADGRRIFINAGALMEAKTPNEVIGVLAHETGHMAGGHLARIREQLAHAQTASIIAMLLGLGAMVGAARSGGAGQVGPAAILAPQEALRKSLLAYQRAQEEQADKAGVKFLTMTGQSPKGMYDTFKRMSDQLLFTAKFVDPYAQSHPMPAERVAALAELAKSSPYWDKKDPPELQLRHDLMRAKLAGFLDRGDTVGRMYPLSDTSLAARYARAIATYRHSDLRLAISQIDGLIAAMPNNPYFYELKGQALLEGGHPAEAVGPLHRAVQLAPSPALIQILLAQAILASNEKVSSEEAINLLRAALVREPEAADAYTQLAMAYGRKNDYAQADLASANAAFLRGDAQAARMLATRAKTRLPVGSPAWVRADDLVNYKPMAGTRPN
ncbi:MAG TPA: M48 family metalloprotease [Pseudolabrys sp.]|nr:M48 family metalloprotease [Pseudolabrys sp.]